MSRRPGSCLWQWPGCSRRAVTLSSSSASGPAPACASCADRNWARASDAHHHFAAGADRSACKKQRLFPETEIRILGNGRRVCVEGTRPDRQRPPWALSNWRRVTCPGCKRARTARPPAKKRGRGWPRYTHFASPGAARSKCGSVSSKVFIGLNFCWTNVNCPRCLAMRADKRTGPIVHAVSPYYPHYIHGCGGGISACHLKEWSSVELPKSVTQDRTAVNCKRCLAALAFRNPAPTVDEMAASVLSQPVASVQQSALLHLFNQDLTGRGEELDHAVA